MCLGLAARVLALDPHHPDLAVVEIAGVQRTVNVGLLDKPVAPGDWLLVHMGFALGPIPDDELADVLASLGLMADEREADSLAATVPEDREPQWTR
jgi:hydrogenase expression/formation protein HypC